MPKKKTKKVNKKGKKKINKNHQKGGKREVKKPYKKDTFEAFILWSMIPWALRRLDLDRVRDFGFDTDDPLFSKLLRIRTRTQFAKEFEVDRSNLAIWEKNKEYQTRCADFKEKMILKYAKDIDFHFTQQTIKYADAARVKLWKQLYEGWIEKQKTEHAGTISLIELFEKSKYGKRD